MTTGKTKPKDQRWRPAVILLLLPVLVPVVLVMFVLFLVSSLCLHIAIWTWWCLRGGDVLFVYSDSPIWHDYVEQRILPHLGDRAVVLNWSHRKRLRPSLRRFAFRHFGGYREFNPMAVVFRPFRRSRTFRFWQVFKDFKRGQSAPLQKMEEEFFGVIGVRRQPD